jgi:hypothetical protein
LLTGNFNYIKEEGYVVIESNGRGPLDLSKKYTYIFIVDDDGNLGIKASADNNKIFKIKYTCKSKEKIEFDSIVHKEILLQYASERLKCIHNAYKNNIC